MITKAQQTPSDRARACAKEIWPDGNHNTPYCYSDPAKNQDARQADRAITDVLHLLASGHVLAAKVFLADHIKRMPPSERESADGFRLVRALNWLDNGHVVQAALVLGEPSRAAEADMQSYQARLGKQGIRSQWAI